MDTHPIVYQHGCMAFLVARYDEQYRCFIFSNKKKIIFCAGCGEAVTMEEVLKRADRLTN